MPIKRRTPAKRTSRPREALPQINVAPRILSADEKHQLILAHAAARHPVDPVQRMSVWAGVAVCMLFVIGAWAYTVGNGIRKSMASPLDPNLADVVEKTKTFTATNKEDLGDLSGQLKTVAEQLNRMSEEQAVLDAMINQLAASSTTATSTDRNDIFKPKATSTSVTSSTKP